MKKNTSATLFALAGVILFFSAFISDGMMRIMFCINGAMFLIIAMDKAKKQ